MGILTLRHCDVKVTSYIKIFMSLNSELKNNPFYQIRASSSNYLENNPSFFFNAKNDLTHCKQKVAVATSDWNGC